MGLYKLALHKPAPRGAGNLHLSTFQPLESTPPRISQLLKSWDIRRRPWTSTIDWKCSPAIMLFITTLVATWCSLAAAHTVIVYPGWRGNNIHTNGTVSDTDPSIIPGSLGITYKDNGSTAGFPYGMQWMYPCTFTLLHHLKVSLVTRNETKQNKY